MSEWKLIDTAPHTDPAHADRAIMLWVADGGDRGKGCVAFGRCYRSSDGTMKAVASGFHGDWKITHWQPMPEPPKSYA